MWALLLVVVILLAFLGYTTWQRASCNTPVVKTTIPPSASYNTAVFKNPIPASAAKETTTTLAAIRAFRRTRAPPRHVRDTGLIPRRVFLTHRNTASLPDHVAGKLFEHTEGWDVHFYDDDDCVGFLKSVWGDAYVKTFANFRNNAHKADLWRYAALYCYGGVYLDCDMQPLDVSLNDVVLPADATLISCVGANNAEVFNSFLAARPGSPALLASLDFLMHTERPQDNLYFLRHMLSVERKVILFSEVHLSASSVARDRYGHRVFVQNQDGSKILYRSRYADYPWQQSQVLDESRRKGTLKPLRFDHSNLEKLRVS